MANYRLEDLSVISNLLDMKLCFVGDSITAEKRSNYVTLVLDILSDRVDLSQFRITNAGVDSSTIINALDLVPDILLEEDPDIFVIFIGVNDTKIFRRIDRPLIPITLFEESYSALLSRIDADRLRHKVLVTIPPPLFDEIINGEFLANYWYWDSSMYVEYVDCIRRVADKHNCIIAEVYEAFKHANNGGKRLFYDDGVHPNIYGHKVIAGEIVTALIHLAKTLK